MATWALSPQYKKSAIEKMFFFKDGKVITMEQGFRWATFKVESDERPLNDLELKNEDSYELSCIDNDECWEMWEMIDGCWCDITGDEDVSDEEIAEFESAWEDNSYEGVEELGWSQDECEYYYVGPLELTNEDTGEVFCGEPEDEVPTAETSVMEAVLEELIEEEESTVTDWFPVSTNPVREGMYQALETEVETAWPFPSNVITAVWNGKKWDNKNVVMWRGLTENPNEM